MNQKTHDAVPVTGADQALVAEAMCEASFEDVRSVFGHIFADHAATCVAHARHRLSAIAPGGAGPVEREADRPLNLTMPNGDVLTVGYPRDKAWASSWDLRSPDGRGATNEQDWEIVETYGLTAVLEAYAAALAPASAVVTDEQHAGGVFKPGCPDCEAYARGDEPTTAKADEREAVLNAVERNWNAGPDALTDAILSLLATRPTSALSSQESGL